jgi:hypothetical protein
LHKEPFLFLELGIRIDTTENDGGRDVELSEDDLKDLRQLIEDAAPKGDR